MAVTYGIDRTGSAGSGGSALAYPFDSLTDPNADRIVFWDDSAGDFNWLTAGSGLTLTDVTLVVNIDDTPQNGVTNNAISSNWAYDHVAAADPHTGYRLESDDHTHQSTGAQGGQLDHGLALTGLTDDDHTQYALLAGRSSGQSLVGGTAASETLTLRGTSHATKGLVLLNDAGGDVQIGGAATASALRFMEPSGAGSNYTGFKAPDTLAGNVVYKLPTADATVSGHALKSDGSGNLSWGAAGGGASADVSMAGHGFSVGNVLYHNGTTYALADADAASTAEVVGIVSAVADADNFTLALGGAVTGLSGLTAGTVYFLSGTAGALTATEPSTVGQISKPLLIAYSTTAGYFFNMRGQTVGSASSTLAVDRFSGDGSDTTFTLSSSPLENNTFVYVEGVYQQKDTYSISGTTLTFSTAPPSGTDNIEVITVGSVNIGTPSDSTVGQAKLDSTLLAAWPSGLNTQVGLAATNDGTNPNYQIRIDCTEIVLKDSGDLPRKFSSWSNALVDLTASGAGGLDTGSEASSTWYYIWLIAKEDGTKSQMFSTSATSPTMPSGYTYRALVGGWRNDGSGHLRRGRISGRKFFYMTEFYWSLVSAGAATSWTDLSSTYATQVPPAAPMARVTLYAGTAPCYCRYAAGGTTPESDYHHYGSVAGTDIKEIPNTGVYYYAVSSGGTAYHAVNGYDF